MKKQLLFLLVPALISAVYFLQLNSPQVFTSQDFLEWKIEQKKNKKPNPGHPDKAMQWYFEQRAYPLGYIPDNWREEAMQHISRNNIAGANEKITTALNWTQLGPGNFGGRIRSIVIHPSGSEYRLHWFCRRRGLENY